MKNVVVIGGGASGLVAAIYASINNKVTLIEKNNECGKKILITGNGKCNYFNTDQNISHYHSKNSELLPNIINNNNLNEIKNFFDKIGIIPFIKNGYYYPHSKEASSIRKALLLEIKKRNIKVINNLNVNEIIKKDTFVINPNKENIKADKIILCPGSKASPKTGSDGSGYILAQKLNHSLITPKPALTSLISEGSFLKIWSGVRCEATLSLYIDNNFIKQETGELQLTDYGISGICTFNLSHLISQNTNNIIHINFIPFLKENPFEFLKKQNSKVKNRTIPELLNGFLNHKLIEALLKSIKLNKNKTINELSKKEFEKLVKVLTDFELPIKDVKSFDKAQVCSGGIPLTEINPNTMESKKYKNVYLAGEILDTDGDCGGYNLTFAFITGMIAGKNI